MIVIMIGPLVCQRLPKNGYCFATVKELLSCVEKHYIMTCCPEGKYLQIRYLPEAERTRRAPYGLYELA